MNNNLNNKTKKATSPSGRAGVGIKVCGMKYKDNIQAVAALQPDYLGFIFYEKSSRYFEGEIPQLSKNIKKTGVFVDSSIDYVLDKVKKYDLQAVQLHGEESPKFCDELRNKLNVPPNTSDSYRNEGSETKNVSTALDMTLELEIIKVFSIKDDFDFSILEKYEGVVDYFLFDTKGKLPGGNGFTFNWKVLKKYPSKKPFFLSGGIGLDEIEKVKEILKTNLPIYTIDVNSKFETEPGLKDIEKLKELKKNRPSLRVSR
jgi:phosphoribosylanthranilate isomerase